MMSLRSAQFSVTADEPLTGDIDLQAILARVGPDQKVKGMLYSDLVTALAGRWDMVATTLDEPPRLGRYVPFVDYSARDYIRLIVATAAVKHPRFSPREGARLLGRASLETFERSQLGAVMMSMVDRPEALLAKYPSIYTSLVKGTPIDGKSTGEHSFELTFPTFVGLLEFTIGSVEAVVLHFRAEPRLAVTMVAEHLHIKVEW